jgi:hypothetical protein
MILGWVVAAISAATVAANILGVRHAARTQRQIAKDERIGDKRTDTYLELLKWVQRIEGHKEDLGILDIPEVLRIPPDLDAKVTAFASDEILRCIDEFRNALCRAYLKFNADRAELQGLILRSFVTKDFSPVHAAAPEIRAAWAAEEGIRAAIRHELLGARRPSNQLTFSQG